MIFGEKAKTNKSYTLGISICSFTASKRLYSELVESKLGAQFLCLVFHPPLHFLEHSPHSPHSSTLTVTMVTSKVLQLFFVANCFKIFVQLGCQFHIKVHRPGSYK